MSRAIEDILFGGPSPRARVVTWGLSAAVAGLLAYAIVARFHAAGQFELRLWEFFGWTTTWAFLAKGLLGTLASAAMAAVIALVLGLVLLLGRLSRLRLARLPSVAVIEFLRGVPTLQFLGVDPIRKLPWISGWNVSKESRVGSTPLSDIPPYLIAVIWRRIVHRRARVLIGARMQQIVQKRVRSGPTQSFNNWLVSLILRRLWCLEVILSG